MGVYIKGMEMPETCKLCYLSEFDPGFYAYVCKPTGIRIDYDMAKIDRPRTICPLVSIQAHGRLIDADALFEEVYKVWGTEYDASECNTLMGFINDAPTIIPAEEAQP